MITAINTFFYTERDDNNDSVDYLFSFTRIDTQENYDVYLARNNMKSLLLQYGNEISEYQSAPLRYGFMIQQEHMSNHAYVMLTYWDVFEPHLRPFFFDSMFYQQMKINEGYACGLFADVMNPYLFNNHDNYDLAKAYFEETFHIPMDIHVVEIWNGLHPENTIDIITFLKQQYNIPDHFNGP